MSVNLVVSRVSFIQNTCGSKKQYSRRKTSGRKFLHFSKIRNPDMFLSGGLPKPDTWYQVTGDNVRTNLHVLDEGVVEQVDQQPSSGVKERYTWRGVPTNSQKFYTVDGRGSCTRDWRSGPSFCVK